MVRGVAKRSLSQRCVGLGGSPRGIAEFGKCIASSRGEWLSGEGASCGGELAKMDEGGCAVRARLVGARVAALSARRSSSCGGSFTQEFIPTSRPEQLDTAVELGWWNAGLAGGAIQEHAGCKNIRTNSFQPRTSSSGLVGCTTSLRPVRMAVRRAPRARAGEDCSVRLTAGGRSHKRREAQAQRALLQQRGQHRRFRVDWVGRP